MRASLWSVIDHIPHSPRLVVETFDRVLNDGRKLMIETSNISYEYNGAPLNEDESAPFSSSICEALKFRSNESNVNIGPPNSRR